MRILTLLVLVSAVAAGRPATKAESAAIKLVAMPACRAAEAKGNQQPCGWRGATVSTLQPRYAYGEAVAEGFGGVFVQKTGKRYRVVLELGADKPPCTSFAARYRAAVKDLALCY